MQTPSRLCLLSEQEMWHAGEDYCYLTFRLIIGGTNGNIEVMIPSG